MLKNILLLTGLLASCTAWSAATPRGSAYDSRMQTPRSSIPALATLPRCCLTTMKL